MRYDMYIQLLCGDIAIYYSVQPQKLFFVLFSSPDIFYSVGRFWVRICNMNNFTFSLLVVNLFI